MASVSSVLFDRSTMEVGPVIGQGTVNDMSWRKCAVLPEREDLPAWQRCALPEESFVFVTSAIER